MDSTGLDIISKLAMLGQGKQVCLQWIPPHVGVPENEAVDDLAERAKMSLTWRNPPAHHWHAAKSPAYLYSAGVPGLFRRPWHTLEAITCAA
ncbi:hypothetical protein TNCV_2704671 [Trichonephila clavipes]|nr:hypothetical protein TNCV_2704671 [Trichonephila clavipes]